MGRYNETSLFWPLPIGLSFGPLSTITIDLIIPAVFERHSIIHFDFIVIMVHATDCLKRIRGDVGICCIHFDFIVIVVHPINCLKSIRGDVGICCDELKELVAAKGQDELDKLAVAKGHFELDELVAAKSHGELVELVAAKGHLIVRCHSFVGWLASRNVTWFDCWVVLWCIKLNKMIQPSMIHKCTS